MEISKSATKYKSNFKRNRTFDSIYNPNYLRDNFLPIPWKIWPYEGKLLLILIGTWSVLGLFMESKVLFLFKSLLYFVDDLLISNLMFVDILLRR